jgi:hypothetical protein
MEGLKLQVEGLYLLLRALNFSFAWNTAITAVYTQVKNPSLILGSI